MLVRKKMLVVLALLMILGLTLLRLQRSGPFSSLGSTSIDGDSSASGGGAAQSESLPVPETRPGLDEGAGSRESASDADAPSGLIIHYEGGAPVSGVGAYAIEEWTGGLMRSVSAGASRLLTETSELGVLALPAETARDDLRGVALALTQRSALVLPMSRLREGEVLTIGRLIPQELRVIPPKGAQLSQGQTVEVQIGSKGDAGFTAPWMWGSAQAPKDLFAEYHLTYGGGVDEPAYYVAEPVVFGNGSLKAIVPLPQTPCLVYQVSAPFGWELAGLTMSTEFRPSGDTVELRFEALELRKLRVRSESGSLWPGPNRVLLARKALEPSGLWSTKWELELDIEPSALIEGETVFVIPSEHESGAAAIIAEYGEGVSFESEVYSRVPEYAEIQQ
jgi:hypothetical protein